MPQRACRDLLQHPHLSSSPALDLREALAFLPPHARNPRYVQIALLRSQGVKWKEVALQVGLSRGRCQNLVRETWWQELLTWAGRRTWADRPWQPESLG